jgi:hypothetical protein
LPSLFVFHGKQVRTFLRAEGATASRLPVLRIRSSRVALTGRFLFSFFGIPATTSSQRCGFSHLFLNLLDKLIKMSDSRYSPGNRVTPAGRSCRLNHSLSRKQANQKQKSLAICLSRKQIARLFLKLIWRRAIFPEACAPSIVAATAFHDRVRKGNGWDHCAKDTRNREHFSTTKS